jgi:hypothetical protein
MPRSKNTVSGALALALLLAAIAPAAAQDQESMPEAAPWSTIAVPIEGTLVGEHSVDMEAPGCAPGTSWRFNSSGTGQIAGVGDVEFVLTQCTVFDPETGTGTFGDGTITFTTTDGDTLEIAQAGRAGAVPGSEGAMVGWTMGGTWDGVSGTGVFANASGHGWVGGVGDIPGPALYSFGGNIEYEAAEPVE